MERDVGVMESHRQAIRDLILPELHTILSELKYHREQLTRLEQRLEQLEHELREWSEEVRRDVELIKAEVSRKLLTVQEGFDRLSIKLEEKFQRFQRDLDKLLERSDLANRIEKLEKENSGLDKAP